MVYEFQITLNCDINFQNYSGVICHFARNSKLNFEGFLQNLLILLFQIKWRVSFPKRILYLEIVFRFSNLLSFLKTHAYTYNDIWVT